MLCIHLNDTLEMLVLVLPFLDSTRQFCCWEVGMCLARFFVVLCFLLLLSSVRRLGKTLFWSLLRSAHSICLRPKELCQSNCLYLFLSVFSSSTVA